MSLRKLLLLMASAFAVGLMAGCDPSSGSSSSSNSPTAGGSPVASGDNLALGDPTTTPNYGGGPSTDPPGQQEPPSAAVPEPATGVLFLGAVGAAAALQRLRGKHAKG